MEQGLDRAQRQPESGGGLVIGFVFHVEQNDGLAIASGSWSRSCPTLTVAESSLSSLASARTSADCSSSSESSETCGRRFCAARTGQAFWKIAQQFQVDNSRLPGEPRQRAPDPQEDVLRGVLSQCPISYILM